MIVVLLCAPDSLDTELRHSVLHRRDVQRLWAGTIAEARDRTSAEKPDIVLVDGALPDAAGLVAELRENRRTRRLPILGIARGDPTEEELLQAGVNWILRLPPDREWDNRLLGLMNLRGRREARVSIKLDLTAGVPIPALVLNLSASGMRVLCLRRLEVGDEVHLSFRLPGRPEVIHGAARVVHVVAQNQYGVRLTRVEAEGRRLIQEFFDPGSNAS
jgi:CheY-like chemotaxis protein